MQAVFPIGSPSIACLCPPITLRRALFFVMIVSLSFLIGISPIAVYRFTSGFQGCVTLMIGTIGTFRAWGVGSLPAHHALTSSGLGKPSKASPECHQEGSASLTRASPPSPTSRTSLALLTRNVLFPETVDCETPAAWAILCCVRPVQLSQALLSSSSFCSRCIASRIFLWVLERFKTERSQVALKIW